MTIINLNAHERAADDRICELIADSTKLLLDSIELWPIDEITDALVVVEHVTTAVVLTVLRKIHDTEPFPSRCAVAEATYDVLDEMAGSIIDNVADTMMEERGLPICHHLREKPETEH